jgi:uncharacterized protein
MNTKRLFGIGSIVLVVVFFVGCQSASLLEKSRTVSVSGTGKVTVVPDTASFSVSVSELGETTKEAQSLANEKMNRLLTFIKEAGIPDKDRVTTSIGFRPEYRWKENDQILIGQRASQTLSVTVRGIIDNSAVLPQLIDAMGTVSNITVSSIQFSKEDTSEAYSTSRALAMEKAMQKAMEYAAASGMQLGKPISIQDYANSDYQAASRNVMKADAMYAMEASFATEIPTGELDITSTVSVIFEIR